VDLGSFPALIPGNGMAAGVLLEIDSTALTVADRIEGYFPERHDCFYVRKEIVVTLNDGEKVKAWTYEYAQPERLHDSPRVPPTIVDGVAVYAWPARP